MRKSVPVGVAAILLTGCASLKNASSPAATAAAEEPLRQLLESRPALVEMLRHAEERRIQIVLGWFQNDEAGRPTLWQASFRGGAEYFYPASTVKTFAAVAALERLAEIRRETGLPLDRDTPMHLYPLFAGEKLQQEDETHRAGGTIAVGHEVRKLAIVSDNEAFNRLYELVGQDGLAASLARAGMTEPRIVHRLAEPRSAEENRRTPRIDFVLPDGELFTIAARESEALQPPPPLPGLFVGKGYMSNDARVDEPMDFSGKNRIWLTDLQRGLCKLVRPDADCGGGPPFQLEETDREFLLEAMTIVPRESTDPVYDPAEYPDSYVKNLLPGLEQEIPRARLRIVNKTGEAYGFSIENAWVEDRETGRGYFLAATIYTNDDGILNDDRYEYETVARPFFVELGRALGAWLGRAGSQSR
jgi:hypothetical protein